MKAKIKQVEGLTFIARGETNHWIAIDGPKKFQGSEAASRPMELLLMSLASCTGSDVASILNKKRVKIDSMEIDANADRQKEHPKVFTKINLKFKFKGSNIKEKDIKRAINLSKEKYCPIAAMLKNSTDIKYEYEIIEN